MLNSFIVCFHIPKYNTEFLQKPSLSYFSFRLFGELLGETFPGRMLAKIPSKVNQLKSFHHPQAKVRFEAKITNLAITEIRSG
jgi:hypothetical protein